MAKMYRPAPEPLAIYTEAGPILHGYVTAERKVRLTVVEPVEDNQITLTGEEAFELHRWLGSAQAADIERRP